MNLQIILEEYSLEAVREAVHKHFGCKVNYQKEMSIFDSWRLGCKEKFIPEMWKYRIVKKDDRYLFGKVM
jgi:hypothetical protein